MNNFGFKAIFVLFLVTLFAGFGFAAVDLAIVNTTVDGNVYGDSITFSIDYNNIDVDDATDDYNIFYDINGIEYLYTTSDDLNAGLQDSNSLVWDANLYGDLDINICVLYAGDANTDNDCNAFTLHVYYVDLNAISLTSDQTAIYDDDFDLNFEYNNIGDYETFDYNVKFYFDTNLADTVTLSDLNSDANIYTYTFSDWNLLSDFTDVNAYVCLVYADDVDSENDCVQLDFNVYYVDLAITDLDLHDADLNINYGADLNIDIDYNNLGDYNAEANYSILYKINGTTVKTYTFTSDLNAGDYDTNSYLWDSNIGDDVNVMVCIDYSQTDYNSENDCLSEIVHVKVADLDVTDLELNDSSVDESTSVTATLSYQNIGDLSATSTYTVNFYRKVSTALDSTYVAITCTQGNNVTADLPVDDDTTKTCTFTAPSVSSNTTYKIKGVVNYTGDPDNDNNTSSTVNLAVANVSSSKSSGSGSGSDTKPDFIISSFTVPVKSDINKELSFDIIAKNNSTKSSSEEYSIKLVSTSPSKKVSTVCQEYYDNTLGSNKTTKYTCKWLPKELGKYTLVASVTYDGSEKTKSNNSLTKVIEVIVPVPVVTVDTGIKTLTETKTLQDYNDITKFVSDLNKFMLGTGLSVPDNNNIYLPVNVTRDFNCYTDANKKQHCSVKLTLKNDGNTNIKNYTFYELIPDGNNHKAIKFDVNLDANKEFTISYALANPVTKTDYPKFMGVLLNEDIYAPDTNTAKPSTSNWKFPTKTVLFVVAIVIGAAILALVVAYLIDYLRHRPRGFKYYKNHSSREDEAPVNWRGYGSDEHRVKYTSKHKVHEHKSTGPKYKGWR